MQRVSWLVVIAAMGCGSKPATPQQQPPPHARDAPPPPEPLPALQAPPPPPLPWSSFPTLATAGADTCTISKPTELGAATGDAIAGFASTGGIAAWMQTDKTLAIQPLALDGAAVGDAQTLGVADGVRTAEVYAVDQGFVILLLRWGWKNDHTQWWGVVVDREGHAREPVDLGLDDLDVAAGQSLDGSRIGLVVAKAYIAKKKHKARWQELTVDADGNLTSAATKVAVDDLVELHGRWERAELDGALGWVITKDGATASDGIFAGARAPAKHATLLRPDDLVRAKVDNAAEPIPRGDDGIQYEPRGQPGLVRERVDGTAVGHRLRLEWGGDDVGVIAMYVKEYLAWTGTHYLYAYRDDGIARMLPVDCRP
jgi:hypothetical protein